MYIYIHIPFCSHICSYCDFPKMLYQEKFVQKYLKELDKIKIDAVIISDPLLIPIIKKNCKHLEIHLSTQESTTNYLSVKYWLKEGATRVVLAREVSKDEIKEIYNKTKAQLEVFLHGAMCTCISGRCVLSNYFTNRDSNRGGCAQVCIFNFDLNFLGTFVDL